MKIILFEFRKNILRKAVIISTIILICINIFVIYAQCRYNNDAFTNEVNIYNSSAEEWNYYKELHNQIDGKITEKKQDKIIALYNSLKEKIDKDDYISGYTKDAKTGYEFGDYSLVESNFYLPMKYFVSYRSKNDDIVDKAKENVKFYRKTGYSYEFKKNQYIVKRYSGRNLSEFYDTTGWKKLFQYNFSDVVLIVLMFLCILPLFQQERINGMENIILGTKKGRKMYFAGKYISVILGNILFLMIITGVNYFVFDVIYGLNGTEMPVYALEEYQYSPYNLTMLQMYLIMCGLKCLALIVICTLFSFVSNISRNTIISFLIFIAIIIIELYDSGFICSDAPKRVLWAVISPFALFKSNNMFKSFYDMNILGKFCPRISVCIFAQFIIEMTLILLTYWKYKHFNMRKES